MRRLSFCGGARRRIAAAGRARARGSERRHGPHARAPRRRARAPARARAARGDAGHHVPDVRRRATSTCRAPSRSFATPRSSGSPTTSSSTKASGAFRALEIVAVRASIPSDRSFAEYDTALAHFARAAAAGRHRAAVAASAARRAVRSADRVAELAVLASRRARSGSACASSTPCASSARAASSACSRSKATPASCALDPRWHQSLLRFLVQGFEHILDGADHLLFLLCLVVPFRRQLRALVWIVTAFTAGHSVTLIASAYGVAPSGLWFPPLVETLIALSIFYMCVENVVSPNPRTRWPIAFALRARAWLRLLVRAAEHAAVRRRSRADVAARRSTSASSSGSCSCSCCSCRR